MLVGGRSNNDSYPSEPTRPSFSTTLKLGVRGTFSTHLPTSDPKSHSLIPGSNPHGQLGVNIASSSSHPQHDPLMLELLPPPPTINMEELKASCLLGKILGDLVPLHPIIHKTKSDWKFIKGQVEYIDMVNDWIVLHFSNVEDKVLVYDNRPWHVNGLNFVIDNWVPFFDLYSTSIGRINRWVWVSRQS